MAGSVKIYRKRKRDVDHHVLMFEVVEKSACLFLIKLFVYLI